MSITNTFGLVISIARKNASTSLFRSSSNARCPADEKPWQGGPPTTISKGPLILFWWRIKSSSIGSQIGFNPRLCSKVLQAISQISIAQAVSIELPFEFLARLLKDHAYSLRKYFPDIYQTKKTRDC